MIDPKDSTAAVLEPKIVSSWLGLPGSQLPRETMKIIGRPAQPARKKGGSARYSVQDAILMKLGRKLAELGITPHRVELCVQIVREHYQDIFAGYYMLNPGERIEGPFYLVAKEYTTDVDYHRPENNFLVDFKFTFHKDFSVSVSVTYSQHENIIHFLNLENPSPDFHVTIQPEGSLSFFLSANSQIAMSVLHKSMEHGIQDLKEKDPAVYETIGKKIAAWCQGAFDPGAPAIVQNATHFVQDQHLRLLRHLEEMKVSR